MKYSWQYTILVWSKNQKSTFTNQIITGMSKPLF